MDEKYLDKQTIKKIEKDSFESSVLEGDLIIADFPQLEEVRIWWEKLTKLKIINCPQLTELSCVDNNLTELDVSACSNLKELDYRQNLLTSLDLTNNLKLEKLFISDNNFSTQDLSFLSHLVNLKQLVLGNGGTYGMYLKERVQKGIYNRFQGSLETLKNMNKLEMLHIDNTDINDGVKYLSDKLADPSPIDRWSNTSFSFEARPRSKVKEIAWQLKLFASQKQKKWEELGLNLEEIKQWLEVNLEAYEYDFAYYLKKEKNLNPQEIGHENNLEELRKVYNSLSWKDLHQDFTPKLCKEWENKGFNYKQAKEWFKNVYILDRFLERCESVLKPNESNLAEYLQKKGIAPGEAYHYIDQLREEYRKERNNNLDKIEEDFSIGKEKEITEVDNWKNIHPEFGTWNNEHFNYQNRWKERGFDYYQTKQWVDKGLNHWDSDFAYYLKNKGYQDSQLSVFDLIELRKEYRNPQTYLEFWYPLEKRKEITKLDFDYKVLKGDLIIEGWENLEEIDCSSYDGTVPPTWFNIFPHIILKDLPKLKILVAQTCELNNLTIDNCPSLKELNVAENNFSPQNLLLFSKLESLEKLYLTENSFSGSLEPLKNLTKLKVINISLTNIDSGLEHLPNSVETIYCRSSHYEKKGYACGKIEAELQDYSQRKDNYQAWKEFNGSARRWLDKNYPENERCQRRNDWKNYNSHNRTKSKKRGEIILLDISNQEELKGGLRLHGFTSLKELDCSDNQLANLSLTNCKSLTILKCNDNKFNDLNFLTPLTNLKELDISNCPCQGNLRSLKKMVRLEKLNISFTNISEGLEYLPTSCKRIYCNSDYQYKSIKIMEELDKSNCSRGAEKDKYYNLDEWREGKENSMIASIIQLERLYVIRGNIKHFVSKWGVKKIDDGDHNNLINLLPNQEANSISELGKLQSPDELWKHRWIIYGTQFIGRGSAVTGAVLTFQDQGAIGGGILAIYPFSELMVSKLEENLKDKESKWKEFLSDADMFLDNYNELLGTLAPIDVVKLGRGKVSKKLKNLDKGVKEFLDIYDDGEKDGEIEISELITKRYILIKDLNEDKKSKVWGIVNAIKDLEKSIIEYRKSAYHLVNEKEETREVVNNQQGKTKEENISKTKDNLSEKENHYSIDLDDHSTKKGQLEQQVQIETPPK
ncbi:MAG: hypothetical protein I3273_02970 [Candidatus Moeniiplasma glomeromycotorum]|nr:hypothetical protein [Candidatus Moeniiplasma glomeromycotorum]MCE8167580.1 hypothetical protein [Candidatus Moeniiplasma glomeromycotorum]MCE8169068.1 hypothetical protein [Candidatus Moeniiplasma glomeromycotorum]